MSSALARAHAKAGDAARIAGYLGSKDTFDEALVQYSAAYRDQAERISKPSNQPFVPGACRQNQRRPPAWSFCNRKLCRLVGLKEELALAGCDWLRHSFSAVIAVASLQRANAQDLAPRVYVITPLHSNAITLT